MAYTKSTDSERAQRRQADRDRLEQAARALLASEGWQRWVKVRSTNGLARYSFGNQILIALQRPTQPTSPASGHSSSSTGAYARASARSASSRP